MKKAKRRCQKNRKHYIEEKNFFYFVYKANRHKHGRVKVGTCQQKYLSKRMGKLRIEDGKDIRLLAYLEIENITKNKIETIEAHVKSYLEEIIQAVGNDHFEFDIANKKEYKMTCVILALYAMKLAIDYCDMRGWKYHLILK